MDQLGFFDHTNNLLKAEHIKLYFSHFHLLILKFSLNPHYHKIFKNFNKVNLKLVNKNICFSLYL